MSGDSGFTVKDSGERAKFDSGMVRDVTKGKLDWWRLLVGPMARRLVDHVTKGAVKYPDVAPGVPNWTLADGAAELTRFRDSAFRHFVQWWEGDRDEDHAAAVFFNVNGAEYVKAKMAAAEPAPGLLTPSELLEPLRKRATVEIDPERMADR